jgi:nitrite reductase/ring-hydroxylating ferredoxin subunit
MNAMIDEVCIGKVEDIPEGEMLSVKLDGFKLALFHLEDGTICVADNICTHEYAILTDGWLEGCEVECPLHAGRFNVKSGEGLCSPITKNLKTYPCEVRQGQIFMRLPGDETGSNKN